MCYGSTDSGAARYDYGAVRLDDPRSKSSLGVSTQDVLLIFHAFWCILMYVAVLSVYEHGMCFKLIYKWEDPATILRASAMDLDARYII